MEELYQKLMESTVPFPSVICMLISLILSVAIPAALAIYLYKKYHCSLRPLIVGALTWIVFARILEGFVHQIVLGGSAGSAIQNNLLYYALYGGAMAAIFEEFGRLIVMKTALKNNFDNDKNALMYGAGHGGIEMIVILGLSMITNLMYSSQINNHTLAPIYEAVKLVPEDQGTAVFESLITLTETAPGLFLLGIAERIPALALHVALSALVWKAVKEEKYGYFILSLAFHFIADFVTVLVAGSLSNILAAEAVIVAVCLILTLVVFLLLKNKAKEELN